jgi:predicted TPR repeat methyltransferase
MLKKIYLFFFPNFVFELEKAMDDCKTVLDVGCGSNSPLGSIKTNIYSEGVDSFSPSIKKSKLKKIHNKYHKLDVIKIGKKFKSNSFDCVIAMDLIEHLEKKDGLKLIKKMEKIAKKKVIIFTPNGFLPQGKYDNNPWQIHKSGWTSKEMENKGYKVIGINGWKRLRGEYANLLFKPKLVCRIISDITQLFTRNNPKKAFQILCIKTK